MSKKIKMNLADIMDAANLYDIYSLIDDLLDEAMWRESEEVSDKLDEFSEYITKRENECFKICQAVSEKDVEIELDVEEYNENDD